MNRWHWLTLGALACTLTGAITASAQDTTLPADQLVSKFTPPEQHADYEKRVVMIPMRDGVKLYTVLMIPKGAKNLPMVLTRTPYNAAGRVKRVESDKLTESLSIGDDVWAGGDYIRIFQDVRGKYGSEGVYLMTPPPADSGYNPSKADDTNDAWDTIDWLVKNTPESNGRVGMIGSSYEGFTVVMALLHPHPALKVAAPESPMVDGWMGDDWFHYGAFRQNNIDYVIGQTSARGQGAHVTYPNHDQYTALLNAGSADAFAQSLGAEQLPLWHVMRDHPAYDGFWQSQALDKLIAKQKLTVPTMWEQGLWDQEDMWGAIHSYRALKATGTPNSMNMLVMGPWFHSQVNREGRNLGPLVWAADTTYQWRHDVLLPFFDQYLKPNAPKVATPAVYLYNTGMDRWETPKVFPAACEKGCPVAPKPLYLSAGFKLSFNKPSSEPGSDAAKFDEFVSDPANPVPYSPRPVDGANWRTWLVTDQRFVDGRPDVLTYVSDPLTEPMKLSGEPMVHLVASTSGTDADWIVKIIDVQPENTINPTMSGYELPIGIDIFRGRYRTSFEHPEPIAADKPLEYSFGLPMINHTLKPGHRLMVQVQSTLFPLYDRNPQKYVPNIFKAQPADFQKATQRIWHTGSEASYISLPVVPAQ